MFPPTAPGGRLPEKHTVQQWRTENPSTGQKDATARKLAQVGQGQGLRNRWEEKGKGDPWKWKALGFQQGTVSKGSNEQKKVRAIPSKACWPAHCRI